MTKRKVQEVKTNFKPQYLCLLGIGILTFLLRVAGQLDKIFVQDLVWFRGVDSWYHMRLVDAMSANFPHQIEWDMFAKFPDGAANGYPPLLTWIGYAVGSIGGETAISFVPPILLVCIVGLTYFLGRVLFNGWVGVIAALFVAILPGELFHRSMLGFFDHHVLETLLATSCILLFIESLKSGKYRWMFLTGIVLGLYHLTWAGTALFILILLAWLWYEFLRRLKADEDQFFLVKLFSIPGIVAFPFTLGLTSPIPKALTSALAVAPLVLWLLTKLIKDKSMLLFALTAVTPIAIVLTTMTFRYELLLLSTMFWGGDTYIGEASPPDVGTLLATFGLAVIFLPGGLWFAKKDRHTALFWIWAITMLVANVGQRRWGYYTIVPISTLSAFFILYCLKWVNKEARAAVLTVILVFAVGVSFTNTYRLAHISNNINADWYVASSWLKENTPEPFQTPQAYYQTSLQEKPSYGILSWWDYGNWIIRIGERVPLTSPTQAGIVPAEFFASTTFQEAEQAIGELNIKYIVVDQELVQGKWYAVNQRSHKDTPVEDSVAGMLWSAPHAAPYELVYERGTIKIFER